MINIHGGAFMLGHSRMVSFSQIEDCLERGWIVVVPNPRLCPGVNLLNGPMEDIRDLLSWIYDGSIDKFLAEQGNHRADLDNVAAPEAQTRVVIGIVIVHGPDEQRRGFGADGISGGHLLEGGGIQAIVILGVAGGPAVMAGYSCGGDGLFVGVLESGRKSSDFGG